jgi:hypothetical protein
VSHAYVALGTCLLAAALLSVRHGRPAAPAEPVAWMSPAVAWTASLEPPRSARGK